MIKSKLKVLVGMSGGVDSSVAALLLLKQGYDVIGATMSLWTETTSDGACCSLSSVEDARRVANKLGIPHYVLNMENDFKKYVVNYFIKEYESGRTPNPCIACNRYIKFGILTEKISALDINYIATGHYARIEENENRFLLKKGVDETKDQSYVLYNLTQEQLSKTVFPLGEYRKTEIREIAKKEGLITANKPDSQEICFVQDNDYYNFLKTHNANIGKSGNFINTNGDILGTHEGIAKYTIGQRRGLGVVTGSPMFVLDINEDTNEIILGSDQDLYPKELIAKDLNWISIDTLENGLKVKAKIRYKAKESDAIVYPIDKESVKVVFDKPQRAITSGQSIVFYDNDYIIGGGIIE